MMRRLAARLYYAIWPNCLERIWDRLVIACFPWVLSTLMWRLEGIRFYALDGSRIGHMAETANTILRICQKDVDAPDRHVAIMGDTRFPDLSEVIARHLTVIQSPLINRSIYRNGFVGGRLTPNVHNPHLREIEAIYQGTVSKVHLTADQRARGAAILQERYGLSPDDWFIAFHSRDPAYLQKARPNHDWSYHSYRDSSIRAAKGAANDAVGNGGWAIRVGESTNEPLGPEWGPRVIDYASDEHDPFLDLYIFERCRIAIIGGGSGIGFLAQLFDRPVLWTNIIPIYPWPWSEMDMFIPKLIKRRSNGTILSFDEIAALGLMTDLTGADSRFYLDNDLEPIENDIEDIRLAARDLQATLGDSPAPIFDDEAHLIGRRAYGASDLGGARISPSFLNRHHALLGQAQQKFSIQ